MVDPLTVLRFPRKSGVPLSAELSQRIAKHFQRVFQCPYQVAVHALPTSVNKWGKVRIEGGDLIRCAWSLPNSRETRDNTFVRVSSLFLSKSQGIDLSGFLKYSATIANRNAYRGEPPEIRTTGYGQLLAIYEVKIAASYALRLDQDTTYLLADLEPCNTDGKDATKEVVCYSTSRAPVIINLLLVESVVGRVLSRGAWYIIDRSNDEARTVFVQPQDDE